VSHSRYTPTSTDRLRKTNPDDQSNSATAAPLDPSTPNADDSDSAQSRREAAQKRRHGDDDDKKSCGDAANATAPFAAWTNGFVNFGKLDTGLNTSTDYVTTGLSAGLDYWFNPSFTGGFGIGYGNDKSIIGSNGTVSKATGYDVAIYGSYHPSGQTFVDGLLGFGAMQFDSNRFVTDTGDFASGSRNGQQVFGSLTSGYEFKSDQLLVSPYGRLTASWSTLDGFTETGGGVYDLHYNAQTVNSFTGGAGLRAAYKFPLSFGSITLRGRLEYSHEFSGTGTATMGYADWTGGPAFSLKTNSTGTDYLTTGLGTDISFAQNWTFAFDYRTAFGQEKIPPQMFEVKLSSSF